jgi:hypothetical protein
VTDTVGVRVTARQERTWEGDAQKCKQGVQRGR